MFKQISSSIENKISQYLCGIRKGKSRPFLMDLSKAFDCISHELLIAKFDAYGFDTNSLKLIYSYLNEQ